MALRVIRAGETELLLEEVLRGSASNCALGGSIQVERWGIQQKTSHSARFFRLGAVRGIQPTPLKGSPRLSVVASRPLRAAPSCVTAAGCFRKRASLARGGRVNRQPRKLCRIPKRFGGCGSNPHNNKDPETAKMPSRGLGAVRGICAFGGAPR